MRCSPPSIGPDQRAVAGVELLDAGLLLDDRRAVEPDPALGGDDHARAEPGGDADAAERPDRAGDDADDRCVRAELEHRGADLGDRVEAEVRLLKADAAGLQQQHRGGRRAGARVGGGQPQRLR